MAKQNQQVVSEKVTEKAPKVKRINRAAAANQVLASLDGKTTLGELASKADALFVAAGGKTRVKSAAWYCRQALETLETMGVVKLTRPTDLYVERIGKK